MKKKNLKALKLNKKLISKFNLKALKGGDNSDYLICIYTHFRTLVGECSQSPGCPSQACTNAVQCGSHHQCSNPCELPPPPPPNIN